MTRKQYIAALKTLGLTIVGAGRTFGVSARQAQRIAAGTSPVPKPLAKLIRLMIRLKVRPEEIE